MEEGMLEDVMNRFVNHEFDVLVSTTIIESGVDIPNANTIIIDRADRFGFGGSVSVARTRRPIRHQGLRDPPHSRDLLTVGDARRRITAIKQYTALGSGFKIAMRDLEIRGAGNLLGTQQSGHIAAVGFDLYCRLLKQSIAKLKERANDSNDRCGDERRFSLHQRERGTPARPRANSPLLFRSLIWPSLGIASPVTGSCARSPR